MVMKLLNRDPLALVEELVSEANPSFTYDFSAINFVNPTQNANPSYSQNTRAQMIPNPDTDPAEYRESSYIWYDRIDLSLFFVGVQPVLLIDDSVQETKDLIPLIQATYGLVIPEDTVLSTPIVRDNDKYPYHVTLQLNNTGLAWTGSCDFNLRDPAIDIDGMVPNPVLDGLVFPYFTSGRVQGLLYSYDIDCDAMTTQLNGLSVGDPVGPLADVYSNIAPTPWVNVGKEADSNLYDAKVIATGDVPDLLAQGYPVNPYFNHAVIVSLSTTYCSDYGGVLLFQYH